MFDINKGRPANLPGEDPDDAPLAKAHPAADLLNRPGWNCGECGKRNPVTEPFCKHCEDGK